MKPFLRIVIAFAGVIGLAPAAEQLYTADSFLNELENRCRRAEAGDRSAVTDIPPTWTIDTAERKYMISTGPLRDMQLAATENPLTSASAWMRELQRQLKTYTSQQNRPSSEPRKELTAILARKQFEASAPPSAWERFLQSVYAAVGRAIESLLRFAAQHPSGSAILFWVVLVGSLAALAIRLIPLLRRKNAPSTLSKLEDRTKEVRRWQTWLEDAVRAAEEGRHRDAIRCGYWSAVMRLQQKGVLPPEMTSTPRERLHKIRGENPNNPFIGLTTEFERFWYAGQNPGPDDVRDSFERLEALECKPG